MKIGITSVSGQLGKTIAKLLMKEIGKQEVIGLARTPEKVNDLGIEVREADYNNFGQVKKALAGIETVLLISGNDRPENRVMQHRNVINAAKEAGVKKVVYTSIIGAEENTAFSSVVRSNRQTEQDIKSSGLEWVIGRNGIYIEPDLEYIDNYVSAGEIKNSAGDGKCGYTSRAELAVAYIKMLLENKHAGKVYNLSGPAISQSELAKCINQVYRTVISYNSVSIEEYQKERKKELGDFMGTVIAGIYEGIRFGANDVKSDFVLASGRSHLTPLEMIRSFKSN